MIRASIPVDLLNPGQVFASLGFLEAATALCYDVIGGFDWVDEPNIRFLLEADGGRNPFALVLEFLANTELHIVGPLGYKDSPQKKKKAKAKVKDDEQGLEEQTTDVEQSSTFPARDPDRMALPIRLTRAGKSLDITHWADGSSRDDFKLYAGNRSAAGIARAMLKGTREKPRRNEKVGDVKTKGICTLWEEDSKGLAERPFDVLTPIGGSFNFDARGAWTALEAGYSPNDQKHAIAASPVVEMLAAIGLENARPMTTREDRNVRAHYAAWNGLVPASLARPLLAGARFGVPLRKLVFTLMPSGKNRIVTFAEEEISI